MVVPELSIRIDFGMIPRWVCCTGNRETGDGNELGSEGRSDDNTDRGTS